jgi:ParB-like chromosome segregation protein Spo0J
MSKHDPDIRGSFDPSDYLWTRVAETAAYLLMDEGARKRPFSLQEIADHLAKEHYPPGDARRAAYQIEGLDDYARGWQLLAEYAVKAMLRARVIEQREDGYIWITERMQFTSYGREIRLRTPEQRKQSQQHAQVEMIGMGRPFEALPKRVYDPEKMGMREREQYEELKENIKTFGYDPNFPILVNEAGEIIDGRSRKMICDELEIEPTYKRVSRDISGQPLRNVDDLMRATRANIGRGLSTETRNALAQEMRERGVTQREIATALEMSQARVSQVTSAVTISATDTVTIVSNGTTPRQRADDETAIAALVDLIHEDPQRGRRATQTLLRERLNMKIGTPRADKLFKVAESRLAANPKPEPKPKPAESPAHEHIWIMVCSECGKRHDEK